MERKYCLKLCGRFAGQYEIFSESEIRKLRERLIEANQIGVRHSEFADVIYRLTKVLEIRTVDE